MPPPAPYIFDTGRGIPLFGSLADEPRWVPSDATPLVPEMCANSGDGWLHELKHDGYRITAYKDGERVRLSSPRRCSAYERRSLPSWPRARAKPSILCMRNWRGAGLSSGASARRISSLMV